MLPLWGTCSVRHSWGGACPFLPLWGTCSVRHPWGGACPYAPWTGRPACSRRCGSSSPVRINNQPSKDDICVRLHNVRKISAKIENSMNICWWGRVKAICRWQFNEIWLSLQPINKYPLKFKCSLNFSNSAIKRIRSSRILYFKKLRIKSFREIILICLKFLKRNLNDKLFSYTLYWAKSNPDPTKLCSSDRIRMQHWIKLRSLYLGILMYDSWLFQKILVNLEK